jgi:hypothetical protein
MSNKVTVTDVDIPFMSAVKIMVVWAFASVPAAIIVFIVSMMLVAFGTAFLAALAS